MSGRTDPDPSMILLTIQVGNGASLGHSQVNSQANTGCTPRTCWINMNDVAMVQLSSLVCETSIQLI